MSRRKLAVVDSSSSTPAADAHQPRRQMSRRKLVVDSSSAPTAAAAAAAAAESSSKVLPSSSSSSTSSPLCLNSLQHLNKPRGGCSGAPRPRPHTTSSRHHHHHHSHGNSSSDEETVATMATVATSVTTSCMEQEQPQQPRPADEDEDVVQLGQAQQQQQQPQQPQQSPAAALEQRRQGNRRNLLVESAMGSARFLRGLVKAHSARTLLSVLETTQDDSLDFKKEQQLQEQQHEQQPEKQDGTADADADADASSNAPRIAKTLQQALRLQQSQDDNTETTDHHDDDCDDCEANSRIGTSGLVPSPHQTPSRSTGGTTSHNTHSRAKLLQQLRQANGTAAPCLDSLSESADDAEQDARQPHQQKNGDSKMRRHVSFAASDADGETDAVQCQVRLVHLIEDKADCWYTAHERNAFAENYNSVIDYYKYYQQDDNPDTTDDDDNDSPDNNNNISFSNDRYKQTLRTLYNSAHRLSMRETDAHLQTLALHSHARGLEGHIVKRGSVLRKRHLRAVLEAQSMWGWTRNTSAAGRKKFEGQLYTISTKHSAKSRSLALAMAKLDTSEALISICSPWKNKPRRYTLALRQVQAMSSSSSESTAATAISDITADTAFSSTSARGTNHKVGGSPTSNKTRATCGSPVRQQKSDVLINDSIASPNRHKYGSNSNKSITISSSPSHSRSYYQYDQEEGTAATVIKPRPRQEMMTRMASTGRIVGGDSDSNNRGSSNRPTIATTYGYTATATATTNISPVVRRMSLTHASPALGVAAAPTMGGSCRHFNYHDNDIDDNENSSINDNPVIPFSLNKQQQSMMMLHKPERRSSLTLDEAITGVVSGPSNCSPLTRTGSQRYLAMVNNNHNHNLNGNNYKKKLDPLANNSNHNKNKNSKNMQPCKPTRRLSPSFIAVPAEVEGW
jgi:hypothetical protein